MARLRLLALSLLFLPLVVTATPLSWKVIYDEGVQGDLPDAIGLPADNSAAGVGASWDGVRVFPVQWTRDGRGRYEIHGSYQFRIFRSDPRDASDQLIEQERDPILLQLPAGHGLAYGLFDFEVENTGSPFAVFAYQFTYSPVNPDTLIDYMFPEGIHQNAFTVLGDRFPTSVPPARVFGRIGEFKDTGGLFGLYGGFVNAGWDEDQFPFDGTVKINYTLRLKINKVPEPGTAVLLAIALGALCLMRLNWKRRVRMS
jgi:hypothetical protein